MIKKTEGMFASKIAWRLVLCILMVSLVIAWFVKHVASIPVMESSEDGLFATEAYFNKYDLGIDPSIECPVEPRTAEDFQDVLAFMVIHDLDSLNLTYQDSPSEDVFDELRRMTTDELYIYRYTHPEYFNYMNMVYFKEVAPTEGGSYGLGVRLFAKGYDSETMIAYRHQAFSDAQDVLRSLYESGKLRTSMSEKKRAKIITEWLVNHTEYDDDETRLCHTAWSVFQRETAVCDGYVSALQLLLGLDGIQCRGQLGIVKGEDTLHLWTVAVLDGEEMGIDPIGCEANLRCFGMNKSKMKKWYIPIEDLENISGAYYYKTGHEK